MEIILDLGSGNTCLNDLKIVKKMIKSVPHLKGHDVILKWQLFEIAGENASLKRDVFNYAYHFARDNDFMTTASVFDESSLEILMNYIVPFIKIANNPSYYYLARKVGTNIPVYISYTEKSQLPTLGQKDKMLYCVSEYPAPIESYKTKSRFISDHTVGFELMRKLKPLIWEKHLKLPNSKGLDAGEWAITGGELKREFA